MCRISIVVPLFNKVDYIGPCMESIFAQTYPNFELIIIDDGSTDGSAEVVASFLDERIVYIRQKNHGVSVARNKGILAASNELVAFIDADDLWQPDHLMVMRELYHIYPAANIWATGYTILSSDGKHQKQIFMADGFLSIKAYIQAFLNSIPIAWTSALMVRRQSALAAGGFPIEHSHGEDVALWLNLVMRSKGIAISHKITSIYRQTSNGLAATLVTRPDACMSDIVERHLSLSWGGGEGLLLSELYNYYALAHAIGAMLHGNEEVARYFIDLSKKTVRFRVKRKILKYMLVLGFLGTRVLRVSSTFMLVFLLPILKSILGSYKKKF